MSINTTRECPYLSGKDVRVCRVQRDAYIPSDYELREYCRNRLYIMCPLYLGAANDSPFQDEHVKEDR